MNKNTERKLRRLTQNQAKVLKAIVSFPDTAAGVVPTSYISNASGMRGLELGGTVSSLQRNDFIQPFGREGRQFNWEITDNGLKEARREEATTLLNILSRLSGEDK